MSIRSTEFDVVRHLLDPCAVASVVLSMASPNLNRPQCGFSTRSGAFQENAPLNAAAPHDIVMLVIMTIIGGFPWPTPIITGRSPTRKLGFPRLIETARREGPQTITKNGRSTAVLVSVEEWERKTTRSGSLAEFLLKSPLRGADLDIERSKDDAREIDL